jgi:hypothetical protein
LLVAPQNRRKGIGAGHTSRSNVLLWVEASRARISQFASKLAEARRRVVHVAPSWRLHQSQVKDGRVDAMGGVGPATLALPFLFY